MNDIDDEGHLSVLEIYIINKKKKQFTKDYKTRLELEDWKW